MLSEFEADGPQLDEELDYPLRIVLVTDDPKSKESEMEEILLDRITSFRVMNVFFDAFDDAVSVPNEGHIKYEVGSDGLVVIIVDSTKLKDDAVKFIDDYAKELEQEKEEKEEVEEEEEKESKKKKIKTTA